MTTAAWTIVALMLVLVVGGGLYFTNSLFKGHFLGLRFSDPCDPDEL